MWLPKELNPVLRLMVYHLSSVRCVCGPTSGCRTPAVILGVTVEEFYFEYGGSTVAHADPC